MTAENFAYWLQGLLELDPSVKTLNEGQVKMIRQHLGYVFNAPKPAPIVSSASNLSSYLTETAVC